MSHRTERDSLGPIDVPSDKYYGAQTQRSLDNFKIGNQKFPREFIRAYGILKKSAASVNHSYGNLEDSIKEKFSESFSFVIKSDDFYASPNDFYEAYGEEINDGMECSFEKWTSMKLYENISDYTGSQLDNVYEEFLYLLVTKLQSELKKL